jgi:hypothetical protein
MSLVFASHFLVASLLTLLLPIAVLAAVGAYWALLLRQRSPGARSGKVE